MVDDEVVLGTSKVSKGGAMTAGGAGAKGDALEVVASSDPKGEDSKGLSCSVGVGSKGEVSKGEAPKASA